MGASKYTKGCCGWLIVVVVAALVVTAGVVAIMKKRSHKSEPLPVPGPPGAINQKYANALGTALQFFQVQKGNYLIFCCYQLGSLIKFNYRFFIG